MLGATPAWTAGLGEAISRLTALAKDTGRGQNDGNVHAAYVYNGAARVAEVTHPQVTNGLTLSRKGSSSGVYPSLDRFGRVRWQKWTASNGDWQDVTFYGYDYAGNRTYRCSWLAGEHGVNDFSEAYKYDDLHRLIRAQRGCLYGGDGTTSLRAPVGGDIDNSGTIDANDYDKVDKGFLFGGTTWEKGDFDGDGVVDADDYDIIDANFLVEPTRHVAQTWDWSLDAPGNWTNFKEDADDGSSWDLDQVRTHNIANEIDTNGVHSDGPADNAITEVGGQTAWISPKYDACGNLIIGPLPDAETTRHHYVYDAWNRLVEVKADSVGTPGTPGDTIAEYRYDGLNRRIAKIVASGETWDRTDFYYNAGWQVLEERFAGAVSSQNRGNVATAARIQYVWDPRYVDAPVLRDEDLHNGSGGNPNGDCTDSDDERLYYTQDANFNTTALVNTSGTVVERYVYDPYGKVTIYNGDRTSTVTWTNSEKNEILFGGYRYDPESALYHVRNRVYHPTLGRWLQRDPLGYVDGMGLYEYCGGMPGAATDPQGLEGLDFGMGVSVGGFSLMDWTRTEIICPPFFDFSFTGGMEAPAREQPNPPNWPPAGWGQGPGAGVPAGFLPGGANGGRGPGGGGRSKGGGDSYDFMSLGALSYAATAAYLACSEPFSQLVGTYRAWRQLPEGEGLALGSTVTGEISGGGFFVFEAGATVGVYLVRDTGELAVTVGAYTGGGGGNPQASATVGADRSLTWNTPNASSLKGGGGYCDASGSVDLGVSVGGHMRYTKDAGKGTTPESFSAGVQFGAAAALPGGSGKVTGGPTGQWKVFSVPVPVKILDRIFCPEGAR